MSVPPTLHDISMAFHDTLALPRPPRPVPPLLTALVLSPDLHASLPALTALALRAPHLIPPLVLSLRKHHLPRFAAPSAHAPALLLALVRHVPYFYRYIASPALARSLRRLAGSALPHAAPAARMLATWARDLAPCAAAGDPAAMLWISTYRRAKRHATRPFPRPADARFVCPVPPPDACPRRSHTLQPHTLQPHALQPHARMQPADVADTLRLLDHVEAAAKRQRKRPHAEHDAPPHNSAQSRRRRTRPQPALKVNDRVLSVLKRNDHLFPDGDDSLATLRLGDDRFPSSRFPSSSVLSVAEVAKINARKKLSESQTSFTVSWLGPSEEDSTFECLHVDDPPLEDKAITPSTYADIEFDADDAARLRHFASSLAESQGDTVDLAGLDLSATDGTTNVAQKIFRYMIALTKRDLSPSSTAPTRSTVSTRPS